MLVTGIGRKTDGGKRWTLLAMRLLVLFAASFSMAWAVPAEAKRVALIIANSAYHRGSGKSLYNVKIDGPKVEAAVKAVGFDVVTLAPDLGLTEFGEALYKFEQEAMGAEIAMIYYAGHGIQTPAGKFAIPVDADIKSENMLNNRAINVNVMIGALAGARASILVLDACRTNGFADTWDSATRSVQFSFSTDIESKTRNLLALYSAMPGQEAQDGLRDEGSPFANAFVHYIQEPGLELTQLTPRIAQAVEEKTGHLQTPTSSGSMAQVIVLKEPAPVAPVLTPQMEVADFSAAVTANTVEAYRAYVRKWPNSANATYARGKIVELAEQAGADPPAPPVEQIVQRPPVNPEPTNTAERDPPVVNPNPTPPSDDLVNQGHDKPVEGTGPETARALPAEKVREATSYTGDGYARSPSNRTGTTGSDGSSAVDAGGPSSDSEGRDANEFQRLLRDGKVSVPGFHSAAEVDKAPIPQIPGPPKFSNATYPACREEYQTYPTNRAKIAKIDECLNRLWEYSTTTLTGFVEEINAHQQRLGDLQRQTLPGEQAKFTYRPETQKKFSDDILAEFNASGPGGLYRADYEATDRREKTDRVYLEGQRKIFVERSATAD